MHKRIIATAIASIILGAASGLALAQATPLAVPVELSVPTSTIDTTAVLASEHAQVAQGKREIQFHGMAPADLQAFVLSSSNPAQSVLARLGALLPSDGVERSVTLRGADGSRVRVERADNGTLRARIENVAGLSPELLMQIREQLAALGFSRIDLLVARASVITTARSDGSGGGPGPH
jgi:hypothetical protein